MINKQRVRRIRGFLYTCILLFIIVPIILMLVVSFRTLGVLNRLADYFDRNPPAAVGQSYAEDGLAIAPALGEQLDAEPAETPPEVVNTAEPDAPAEDGGYVENTYLPASYPNLRFDTLPVTRPSGEKTICLTFSNTPSAQAEDILAVLAKHGVRATFFVWWNDGRYTENYAFYRQLTDSGHRIGIHSGSSGASFSELYADVDSFLGQFEHIFTAIYEATGEKTRLYRLPGGSVNPYDPARQKVLAGIKAELDARGFLQYDWSASAQDAVLPPLTKAQALANLKGSIDESGRTVVLLHDGTGSTSTAEALDEFIRQYKADGYSFGVLEYDAEPVSFLGS